VPNRRGTSGEVAGVGPASHPFSHGLTPAGLTYFLTLPGGPAVDNSPLRDGFLNPAPARQRAGEALRSAFVDGLSPKGAAQRFSLS
jgi:hypothetical protein